MRAAGRPDPPLRRAQGPSRRALWVSAAIFLHAVRLDAKGLDAIGRQHVYGLEGNLPGLPGLRELLDARPPEAVDERQPTAVSRPPGLT